MPVCPSNRRSLLISRKFATQPFAVRRHVTSVATLPDTVTKVSFTVLVPSLPPADGRLVQERACPWWGGTGECRRGTCGQAGVDVPVGTELWSDRSSVGPERGGSDSEPGDRRAPRGPERRDIRASPRAAPMSSGSGGWGVFGL
ncbi:hypothetical protein Acsp07_60360 [Actinomycetospora sp. NBRC 106378]|nr:hypothetical protein Acsp07_60360 [Actinomycetospora sp. NBRC 106378]